MLQSLISDISNNNGVQEIFPAEMTSFITGFMNQVGKWLLAAEYYNISGSKVSIL
ncbi:MAG TPA: hypothetical protein VE572_00910 [Nitrososphaeraceae archaeon]|jgi:hypothetical protein|nr:hypothetical protein [Nitrososphaeraceae archaeon]